MLRYIWLAVALAWLASAASTAQEAASSVPDTERRIAITIDDAPLGPGAKGNWDRAGALIEGLNAAGVQAIFFVTTDGFEELENGKARVERYADAGHLIANHTHSHPWLYQVEADDFLSDIDRAEAHLEGLENRRLRFRYPFLDQGRRDSDKRQSVWDGLDARGLGDGYVTVDTYDWHLDRQWRQALAEGASVDEAALSDVYVAMIVDAAEHAASLADSWLDNQPVHTLLLHENDAAASFLPAAIKALRGAGWTIVTPDEAYARPLPRPAVTTGFTGMGRVAALAWERGARGEGAFDHWSASESGIEERLASEGAVTAVD